MARISELKAEATARFSSGDPIAALRIYDHLVRAMPLDFEARLGVADCLARSGSPGLAIEVYRAVAFYALKAGHPLLAVVCARVLESLGGEADDVLATLVVTYGSESPLVGQFAARIHLPDPATVIPASATDDSDPAAIAERAATCTATFTDYPEAVHPIPLLSALSEDAFRRVLETLVVRRVSAGERIIAEGEPGESFFFLATGGVRVYATDGLGRDTDLATLRENAIFGEMALISAQPRSASVIAACASDLIEVTRASLAAVADELAQVATALHDFTRERLLANLMATNALFRPFSPVQRRDLLRRFTSHDVAPQTTIIRQGDPGRGLFVVLSGEVEVVQEGPGGAALPLATLRAGDLFGEMAIVRDAATTATVTAARPSTVLYLAREYVERIVAAFPEIRATLEALAEDRALDTQLAGEVAPAEPTEHLVLI